MNNSFVKPHSVAGSVLCSLVMMVVQKLVCYFLQVRLKFEEYSVELVELHVEELFEQMESNKIKTKWTLKNPKIILSQQTQCESPLELVLLRCSLIWMMLPGSFSIDPWVFESELWRGGCGSFLIRIILILGRETLSVIVGSDDWKFGSDDCRIWSLPSIISAQSTIFLLYSTSKKTTLWTI